MTLLWLGRKVTRNPLEIVNIMAKPAHIIVDGYNLIRQIPALSQAESHSLENGRKKLIRLLARYIKLKQHGVTVVFDGAGTLSEFAPTYREAGIDVCFSPFDQSADDVIGELCRKKSGNVIVVSSDRGVTDQAAALGHATLDAPEFYHRLVATQSTAATTEQEQNIRPNRHKRWTTQKKGPSKKLPKRLRRNQNRLKNL